MTPAGVRTTCPYCGVGCGVLATARADGTVQIEGDPEHPANRGRLCSKGSALAETLGLEGRLLHPEIGGREASWDEALDLVAHTFSNTIRAHGPDSVAFYVSGQILTEDYYVTNKLMKGFIGAANIDTNSRLCMASSVAGHRRAFGTDTVPGAYEDLELADLIVLVGSNLAWCHPVLHQRIAAAKAERPQMTVVLIDPRRTMTAELADLQLAIAPDGDVALFAGLLAHLEWEGRVDRDYVARHTSGLDDALATACGGRETVASLTGLRQDEIESFYGLFAGTEKVVTVYSQGVNQSGSGTDKVNAIINCHLATGRIGRPGMGPFSVTGQPNAMGGREVGGLANMLAAHMEIEKPTHRDIVQRFWRSPAIAEKPGLKAVDMFRAVADGRIKAIWIMGTNPVVSLPDADTVAGALASCPFVVISDVTDETDTAAHADVKLPSAAWGEKNGTVTNSERCISRQRAFLATPGAARPDWWQMAEVARRMGFADAFAWQGPADIFREHAALTAFENAGSRALDIGAYGAITAGAYEALAPFRWPRPAGARPLSSRFFGNGNFYTPDRKARLVPVEVPQTAIQSERFSFTLNTGRVRDHWHTMTRTGLSARLSSHMAEPFAEIHPADAAGLGICDAQIVEVESAYGKARLRALITTRQQRGSLFAPMHWNDRFAGMARIDAVVAPVTDPVSGQPALKATPVRLRRYDAVVYGFAIGARRPDAGCCGYWAMGHAEGGWRLEIAHHDVLPDPEAFLRQAFGIDCEAEFLACHDTERASCRLAAFCGTRLLAAVFLSREPVAVSRSWAAEQLMVDHDDPRARWRLIAGRPGGDMADKGAIVCSCMSVGTREIATAIRGGAAGVDGIGEATGAGTNCGSCKAEIKGIIDAHLVAAAE